jgi:hypothetical protein
MFCFPSFIIRCQQSRAHSFGIVDVEFRLANQKLSGEPEEAALNHRRTQGARGDDIVPGFVNPFFEKVLPPRDDNYQLLGVSHCN